MTYYQQLIDSLLTSIIVLDETFVIQYLNESAENLIHRSVNQARGKPLASVLHVDAVLQDALDRCLNEKITIKLRDHDVVLTSALENHRIDCQLSPISFENAPAILMEIPNLDVDGREYEIRARQQSGHEMIRGLAHEIRNPLGGIRGAAQLLCAEFEELDSRTTVVTEYTDVIIREVDRLSALVSNMQSSGTVKIELPVNIHGVLEHVRQLLEPSLSPGADLSMDYDPSLPPVLGDEAGLTQVVINILRNAVEAIEPIGAQGKITLQTRIDHRMLSDHLKEQVIRVTIRDNGPGIDDHMIHKIFEPLVTTKTNGSGLGLGICSEIVRQHGGLIDVKSEPGKTEFHVFLKTTDFDHG